MERFRAIPPTGTDYFRHIVENGRLKEEIEPLGKAGFFSGEIFDRHAFDAESVRLKNERRMNNTNIATGRVNGKTLVNGNPRK